MSLIIYSGAMRNHSGGVPEKVISSSKNITEMPELLRLAYLRNNELIKLGQKLTLVLEIIYLIG
jgi:hypothetical protein